MINVLSIVAIFCLLTPFLILLIRGLWGLPSHIIFACYWLLTGSISAINKYHLLEPATHNFITAAFNWIDFLIVAWGIYTIAKSSWVKRIVLVSIPIYIIVGIYYMLKYSIVHPSFIHMIPISIVFVVLMIMVEIFQYFQKVEHSKYETSIIFILGAIFFQYTSFTIIYILENYFKHLANVRDIYTIYYVSAIIAMLFAILGYTQKQLKPVRS